MIHRFPRLFAASRQGVIRLLAFSVTGALLLESTADAASVRYVPMPEAPRSLHIALATNLHVAFDTERLRLHTAWTGAGLKLQGTPHTGNKTPFFSTIDGTAFHSTAPLSPWFANPRSEALTAAPIAGSQFLSWSKTGQVVTLKYRIGAGGASALVEERLRPLPGFERGIIRTFDVLTGDQDYWYSPVAEFLDGAEIKPIATAAVAIRRANTWLVVARVSGTPERHWVGGEPLQIEMANRTLRHEVERAREGDSERIEERRSGNFVRVLHPFKARSGDFDLAFAVVEVPELPANPRELVPQLRLAVQAGREGGRRESESTLIKSPALSTSRPSGDDSYVLESFPLPDEVRLGVTGLDWLPNGDLAVCTWRGEVWIVENASGPVAEASYRLFTSGLNEPLGIVARNGDIIVAQKPELTRICDTDGDGIADRFECLNADWHFTGNYHAFTFGPAVHPDGSFLLAFCGQRARWDVDFASWLVRIAPDGSRLKPIAGGLRAPNGIGFFGPDRDVFVTDNQGNWVGACKLNHVQPGRFYGHPAARPAAKDQWDHPTDDFDPPAVWFPRKLAPSAAGFATIPARVFGPFGGQLVVADFQNASVLRVALEKVNGRWQGAVFPFLKGFGSGANRVLFDPQGRLYVGGVENKAWPSAGPFEESLERVRFTGRPPFEIQHVQARPDGFELVFTEPVNREFAGDPDSYFVSQFNYRHHQEYGSPEFDHDGKAGSATMIAVTAARVSDDDLRVRLELSGWKPGYVTRIVASALDSAAGVLLRSEEFYYTLNEIPTE